jgi:hypothetical protein
MSKLEKILPFIALIGFVFKLLDVPLSGPLIVTSLSILAILYYPFGFALLNHIRLSYIFKKSSYKEIPVFNLIGGFISGLILFSSIVGAMFSILSWPGAKAIMVSVSIPNVLLLIISGLKFIQTKEAFFLGILYRVILIGTSAAVVSIANI